MLLHEGGDTLLWTMVGNYPERVTAEMVFQAAEQNDAMAVQIVDEIASYLGIAVANLVNLFNPELIVLGGPVGQHSQVMLPMIVEEVRKRALAFPLSVAQIITSTLGEDASAIGAAVLVLQQASELIFQERG
jgi:glucokinase